MFTKQMTQDTIQMVPSSSRANPTEVPESLKAAPRGVPATLRAALQRVTTSKRLRSITKAPQKRETFRLKTRNLTHWLTPLAFITILCMSKNVSAGKDTGGAAEPLLHKVTRSDSTGNGAWSKPTAKGILAKVTTGILTLGIFRPIVNLWQSKFAKKWNILALVLSLALIAGIVCGVHFELPPLWGLCLGLLAVGNGFYGLKDAYTYEEHVSSQATSPSAGAKDNSAQTFPDPDVRVDSHPTPTRNDSQPPSRGQEPSVSSSSSDSKGDENLKRTVEERIQDLEKEVARARDTGDEEREKVFEKKIRELRGIAGRRLLTRLCHSNH